MYVCVCTRTSNPCHIYLSGRGSGWSQCLRRFKRSTWPDFITDPKSDTFLLCVLVPLWWLGSLAQLLKKATCFEPIGQGQFSCLAMWVLLFCLFIYFYPTITYPFLTGPLATWAGPVCALPASLPPPSFPGSDHLGSLCPCLESLDCSSGETREIRSWRTFDRKAVLCFLLMLLPLPLFPNRDVNTCIFLF